MTIVKANLKDIAKVPVGDGTLTYTRYSIRPDGTSSTGLTTPSAITVPILAGVANSPDLDPGRYELEISVGWFVETIIIDIPQAVDVQLRTLIALAAGIPEETSAEKFQAALTEYFLANPVEGGGGGGLTEQQIATAATTPGAPIKTALDTTYASIESYASNPDTIAVGAITRSANGAATAFGVVWPDGATGVFAGTESTTTPGAIDSYTVTHVRGGVTKTYTQPALTRDASGAVTARPGITVS